MHNLWVSLPSARGVHPLTVWNIFDMRTELEKVGHKLHGASVYRMPLDLARNEMATVFLSTTCDMNLMIDDDVQVDAGWIPKMMAGIDAGLDIISAPCRMRSEGNLFNVVPTTLPGEVGGLRVVECAWTGLGAVLVSRRVFERLHADAVRKDSLEATGVPYQRQTYRSQVMPDKISAAIFQSSVQGAKQFFIESPDDLNLYLLDDRVFSLKAHAAGFKIHAAIDVPTCHDGLAGCFSAEMERFDRARKEAAAGRPGLVGPDGKRIQ